MKRPPKNVSDAFECHKVDSVRERGKELKVLRSKHNGRDESCIGHVCNVHENTNLSADDGDAIDDSSAEAKELCDGIFSQTVSSFAQYVIHDVLRCDDRADNASNLHIWSILVDLVFICCQVEVEVVFQEGDKRVNIIFNLKVAKEENEEKGSPLSVQDEGGNGSLSRESEVGEGVLGDVGAVHKNIKHRWDLFSCIL